MRAGVDAERSLILALGGYAFQFSGGTLVLHERIAVPRFNFVQVEDLSAERQTGFFERTLDQYFQRALRPNFRVPIPTPAHIDRTLVSLGFRARTEPLTLLGRASESEPRRGRPTGEVAHGDAVSTDAIVPFWVGPRERPELSSAIEIVRHHPNPKEAFVPLLAREQGVPVAAGLVYAHRGGAFLFGVATTPSARGRGFATDLVAWAVSHPPVTKELVVTTLSETRRAERSLRSLGFAPWARWRVYELDETAELSLPPTGPSAGPLWRPPRPPRRDRDS